MRSKIVAFVTIFACMLAICGGVEAMSQSEGYRWSAHYSTDAVSNGPWANQFYDFMTAGDRNLVSAYTDMAAVKERGELEGIPTVWVSTMANDDYTWGNKAAFSGESVMKASTGTTNWVTYNGSYENAGWTGRNYPARIFTAPQSGYVRISATEELSATEKGTHIRIAKFKDSDTSPVNIWPAGENAWQHISGSYSFSEVAIYVDAGEKISFENAYIKNTELGNTPDDTVLYWDPVVTYVENYQSSAFFTTASVSNGPWTNGYYDFMAAGAADKSAGYKEMVSVKERGELEGSPYAWLSSYGNVNDEYAWGNNAAFVGAYAMRTSTSANEATFNSGFENKALVGRNYPVKIFNAFSTGKIKISADEALRIVNEGKGTHIRIMKVAEDTVTKVWPEEENWQVIAGEFIFDALNVVVKAGEKITFECAYINDGNGEAKTVISWDPTVEYTEYYPDVQEIIPADGSENVAPNAVHTMSFDKAVNANTYSISLKEVAADGTLTESQAVCDFSNASDELISYSFSRLKEYTKYEVTVSGIAYSDADETWVNSEKYTFTTGAAIDIKPATYDSATKTVTVEINNSKTEPVSADMIVLVCNGTEESYTVTDAFVLQRDDIGANDAMQIGGIEIPTGSFARVAVLKDLLTAVPYGDITTIGGE